MNFLFALIRHLYQKVRKPKSRKSRKERHQPGKFAHRHHPSQHDSKSAKPKGGPTEERDVFQMGFVAEPDAMEEVLQDPHAKSDRPEGPRHTRGTSTTTALAHHPPAITVRSPTASSAVATCSRSATQDSGDAEAEDVKLEHVDTDVESARPVDTSDEDEEGDGSAGSWSIFNVVPEMPWASEFAHGRPIDLSIQFTLWWMPFLVLLGWWTDRPMHLLFGECFAREEGGGKLEEGG